MERGYVHHTQVRRGEHIHRTNVSFASKTIVAPQLISAAASLEINPQPTGLIIVFVVHEEKTRFWEMKTLREQIITAAELVTVTAKRDQ